MSHFQKLPHVNLEFQDLTYTIQKGSNESKLLLKSISGSFRSGQLSAILGPSGAGKTTLLNVLAGYKTFGVNGTLMVNGRPLVAKEFNELSRYIMQQDFLQPFLTVLESMNIAVALKLNREISQEDKAVLISDILDILRLASSKDTFTNKLSGGERRRLSIALELISNPPVIFLDEPTTGLDDFSSSQCISLLKSLAEGGRTVICSLHTPTARMFQKFDNVYVMSQGLCVYRGYGTNVISFLSELGLSCPKHYNPADFVIEVSSGEYGDEYVEKMSKAIENGSNRSYCKDYGEEIEDLNTTTENTLIPINHRNEFFYQFKILLCRSCKQIWRNKQNLLLKVLVSIINGIFIGSIYFNIGQDASKALSNITYCCVILFAITYVIIMPITLHFPPEIKLLQREHFNKWYGLTPYYFAMSLSTVPLNFITVVFYIATSYVMSAQPMEFDRFILVILISSLVTLVAESHGLLVSSVFNVTNGAFVLSVTNFLIVLMALYGIGEGSNKSTTTRVLMYFSYLRLGFESFLLVIFGYDRAVLDCPEEKILCPFRDPKKVISIAGFQYSIIWINIIGLIVWFLIFRIVGFYLLRFRLRTNNPIKSLKYTIQKWVNH